MSRNAIRAAITTAGLGGVIAISAPLGAGAAPVVPEQHRPSAPTVIGNVAPVQVAGIPQQYDGGESTDMPTAQGAQTCQEPNSAGLLPTAGRTWMYYSTTDDTSGLSADIGVTGWSDARAAFAQLRHDTGFCQWLTDFSAMPWKGVNPRTHVLMTSTFNDVSTATAVVRKGAYIVAVTVSDWDNSGDEAAVAQTTAQSLARQL